MSENRQTHLLSLWLDNDEGTQDQVRQFRNGQVEFGDLAREYIEEFTESEAE